MKKPTLVNMVQDLARRFPSEPSWPFRTESARTVWAAAEAAYEADPNLTPDQAVRVGLLESGIPSVELTPEDFNLLGLAARWKQYALREKRKTPSERVSALLLQPQNAVTAREALRALQTTPAQENTWRPRNRLLFSSSSKTRP